MLSGLTGILRFSSTWFPGWAAQCSVSTCRRETKSNYLLQLQLPRWIAICSVETLLQRRVSQPPTVHLRFRPRVDHHWIFSNFIVHDISVAADTVAKIPDCVHYMDSNGVSPLMLVATRLGADRVSAACRILLQAGADLYAENDDGISTGAIIATQYLLRVWRPGVLQEVARVLPMTRMIDELNLSPVSKIILRQSQRDLRTTLTSLPPWHRDLNEPDAMGLTPIHWAALASNPEAVRQLASHGVDPNTKNMFGETPLIMMCGPLQRDPYLIDVDGVDCISAKDVDNINTNRADTVEALLDVGANIKATDRDGQLPLELACLASRLGGRLPYAVIKTLIERGASTHTTNSVGNTLVHLIISFPVDFNDDAQKLRLFLEHGLSPNAQNNLGETPLMHALDYGNADMCALLAKNMNGADFNLVTANGQSIFHYAAKSHSESALKVLIDVLPPVMGVGVDAIDDEGRTAEDVFVEEWDGGHEWSGWINDSTRACFKKLVKSRRYLEALDRIDLAGWWEQWEQEEAKF